MRIVLFLFAFLFSAALLGQTAAADSAFAARQVDSLIKVSTELTAKRDFDKALEVNAAAEQIALEKFGRESAQYGTCCFNRGAINKTLENHPEAEKWLLEAKAIQENVLGKMHPEYALTLNTLAHEYYLRSEYDKSETYFLEAVAIRKQVLGKEHPNYAASLNNLASLYSDLRVFDKAERLYLESKAIREKVYGKGHLEYAGSLINLAIMYHRNGGQYEKMEPLLLEAQNIFENLLHNEAHPYYLYCMDNLANLYQNTGEYEKAEILVLKALVTREKTLGKNHPDYARSLLKYAISQGDEGHFDKAVAAYLETLAIYERNYGRQHPNFNSVLHYLSLFYEYENQFSASEPLLAEHEANERAEIIKTTSFLSEEELAKFTTKWEQTGGNLGSYLLARWRVNQTGKLPALAFDNALFRKGFVLNAAARLRARSAISPESQAVNLRLKECRRRLAAELSKKITERENMAKLEAATDAAEKALARSVAGYTEAIRQVKWQEVQAALRPGESALEFVQFRVRFPDLTDSTMYAALILLPGNAQPTFVPLFEEKQLDSLFKTSGARRSDYVNSLYSTAKTGQKSLYELVWQPIEKALAGSPAFDKSTAGKKNVYFSPSGLLHRIHLAAIPTSETANLGDRFRFVELGSTRQLVVPSSAAASAGSGEALLWGGIQYDMDSTAIGAANEKLKNELARTRGDLGFEKTDSTSRLACQSTDGSRGGSWEYLPWTEKEINAIAPILTAAGVKPTSRKGFAATEEAFKTIGSNGSGVKKPSPRILHIATHGYFFPDPKTADGGRKAADGSEPVFKMSDHPMIRSGLLLAGSNQAWKTGKPLRPDLEDGVLTAYEISQMDLSNTELVVLSACETGLGDIQGNEGVYGLQRAFKIAGAKYLIMSLWQVPDFQTQELMTVFYQKWLTAKMPLPEAFRAAQQAMREKYEHPYFWAGFVLVE